MNNLMIYLKNNVQGTYSIFLQGRLIFSQDRKSHIMSLSLSRQANNFKVKRPRVFLSRGMLTETLNALFNFLSNLQTFKGLNGPREAC